MLQLELKYIKMFCLLIVPSTLNGANTTSRYDMVLKLTISAYIPFLGLQTGYEQIDLVSTNWVSRKCLFYYCCFP